MLAMSPQEIQYCKENTSIISLVIQFIEFINKECNDDKQKND